MRFYENQSDCSIQVRCVVIHSDRLVHSIGKDLSSSVTTVSFIIPLQSPLIIVMFCCVRQDVLLLNQAGTE